MSRTLWLAAGLAVLGGVIAGLLLWPAAPAPEGAAPAHPSAPTPDPARTPPDAAPATAGPPAPAQHLWQEVAPSAVAPAQLPAHREEVPGRVLVGFAAGRGAWRVGDRLQMSIPQVDAVFDARVDEIHRGPSGARAFTGTLNTDDTAGDAHGFVLTVGPAETFAQLSTPHGSYELVGNGRYGWIMPTANMDQDVNRSVPDYHPARRPPPEPQRLPR